MVQLDCFVCVGTRAIVHTNAHPSKQGHTQHTRIVNTQAHTQAHAKIYQHANICAMIRPIRRKASIRLPSDTTGSVLEARRYCIYTQHTSGAMNTYTHTHKHTKIHQHKGICDTIGQFVERPQFGLSATQQVSMKR